MQGSGDRHGPQRGWWGQSPHGLAFAVAFFAPQGHDVPNNFWDEAKQLCNRAMAIFEKTLGPDHPRVATCLNHLAQHYAWVNKYSDAEQLYNRALAITEKSLGPEHPDTITIREGLAILDKKRVQDVMDAYDRYENKPWERSMVSKHF
ncbi:MAG: tetratricopeptide repeat protein [Magnetococcales bacterium]|nr:tetratricopeptide repeat protein [Magnetococcales bacterium]